MGITFEQPQLCGGGSPAEREEILAAFRRIYGTTPEATVQIDVIDRGGFALEDGAGTCTQSEIVFGYAGRSWRLTIAVFAPAGHSRATFLGLNFRGNHALLTDPRLIIPGEDGSASRLHFENAESLPPIARGSYAHRWPIARILEQGCTLVTACYLEIGPDTRGVFAGGPHALLGLDPAMEHRAWGAIGIWAWTLSRVLDVIRDGRLPGANQAPVYAIGHSRLGKTALWAAAQDERFAGVISNDSGALGAALSRDVGETPWLLAEVRPYWFAPKFVAAALAGDPLPADQWQLLSLIAPRLLLVGSAADDVHADPEGERLATDQARRAWIAAGVDPATTVRHHTRAGGHDLLAEDWEHYLAGVLAHLGS